MHVLAQNVMCVVCICKEEGKNAKFSSYFVQHHNLLGDQLFNVIQMTQINLKMKMWTFAKNGVSCQYTRWG